MTGRRRGKDGHWRTCALLLQVLAAMAVDAESTVRSLTDQTSQRRGTSDASRGPHQGFEALRLQDTVAALPSGFEFAEAAAYDAMNARAAGDEGRLVVGAPSQKLYQAHKGGATSNPSGERYHALATDNYGGLGGGSGGSGGFGFPDAMRYYHYGSGPQAYNTEHAYAYEKVYPERSYSSNHATSYEKHYDDNDNKGGPWGGGYESRYSSSYPIRGGGGGYGYRHGDSYGSGKGSGGGYGSGYTGGYGPKGGGYKSRYDSRSAASSSSGSRRGGGGRAGPKIKRYVYKNPYDKSTTRVVEMHSSSGQPSWAAASENRQTWKPDDMEHFVLGLMRNG